MTKTTPTEEQRQLATRIPKQLWREMKLHCVRREETMQAFVTAALRATLARERK